MTDSPYPASLIVIHALYAATSLIILALTFVRRAKYFIRLSLRNLAWRRFILLLQLLPIFLAALWDFYSGPSPASIVGATAIYGIYYLCLLSGLTNTFLEQSLGLLLISIGLICKLVVVGWGGDGWHGVVIYWLQTAVAAINCYGLVREGNVARRIRYIKTRCVEERLAQMKLERMKTDYLLSLSLPKPIVARLRETGTNSFSLIAERIPDASVMFGDLQNFKEVAKNLGSTQDAVVLLNSIFQHMDELLEQYDDLVKIKTISTKILFVGGLSSSPDHLQQMVDMALTLREGFREVQTLTTGAGNTMDVKLTVAFGIAVGACLDATDTVLGPPNPWTRC